ncbi:hypothetical protein FHW67_000478 [Herbaspirillum sp. Sphag1AN]|nr:hypothetical protein [Herbaspirillum sp. Sphag1AN]MBB3244872.1 hypothetical protein [Herbaspirillum sp. Sphag64]
MNSVYSPSGGLNLDVDQAVANVTETLQIQQGLALQPLVAAASSPGAGIEKWLVFEYQRHPLHNVVENF